MATATARHHRSAARLSAGLALAIVAVIAVLAAIIVVVNPSALANRITQRELPAISQSLGRQVTVGEVKIGWFPVAVVLHDVRVAGGPNEPELLHAGSASVKPRLWPLLTSRGTDVQIDAIRLRDAQVNLVKLPDGTFDLPQGRKSQPTERQVSIGEVSLERGAVRIFQAGQGAQPDPLLALTDIHVLARDVAPGEPLHAKLDAAFAPAKADVQNVHLALDLTPLPTDAAAARTNPPGVTGQLKLEGVQLAQLQALLPASAQGLLQGGALGFDANVAGGAGKPITLKGKASLANASLRGQPASGSFGFDANLAPANPNDAELAIHDLKLNGPGIDLSGQATAALGAKRVRFQLFGPLLDLDTLLAVLPQKPQAEPAANAGMTAQVRKQLEALDVAGSLAVNKVVVHKLQAQDLKAQAKLEKGAFVLTQATAGLYGGSLDASGARVDLTQPAPKWQLKARLHGVDMGMAMQQVAGEQPLTGKAEGELDLAGVGSVWAQLSKNLTGSGGLTLADAALPQSRLGAQLAGPLKAALPGKLGGTVAQAAQGTPLKDMAMRFSVRDGFLNLEQPLSFKSDFGTVKLGGRVGLDWRLDLTGDVAVAPGFMAQLSGGNLKPSGETQIPVKLGGTLTHPALQPSVNPTQLASGLLGASPAGKALEKGKDQAKQQIENQARRGLQKIFRP